MKRKTPHAAPSAIGETTIRTDDPADYPGVRPTCCTVVSVTPAAADSEDPHTRRLCECIVRALKATSDYDVDRDALTEGLARAT